MKMKDRFYPISRRLAALLLYALAWMLLLGHATLSWAVEPAVVEDKCVHILGDFEEGVDEPFNDSTKKWAPHHWTSLTPNYSYTIGITKPQIQFAWSTTPDNNQDDINYWDSIAPNVSAPNGYVDCTYKMHLDNLLNYMDLSTYDSLLVKWRAGRTNATQSNMEVLLWNMYNNSGDSLGRQYLDNGVTATQTFSLSPLTAGEKTKVSHIIMRTFNDNLPVSANGSQYQRTHLHSIKAVRNTPLSFSESRWGRTISSKYLGSVCWRRYGTYSACGFWDDTVGKYKLWMGGGIPEAKSSDNVWYLETSSLAPGVDRNVPKRITLNNASVLYAYNTAPGYGGDPTVMKFEGDPNPDLYIMYFSGLRKTGPLVNGIYRATSSDGVTWTLNPTTPLFPTGARYTGAYGSGSPSVVYRNGTYYLWYWSDYEIYNGAPYGTLYLRTSTDGINFSAWTACTELGTGSPLASVDVKWSSTLNCWLGATEIEPLGVFGARSTDGITWERCGLAQAPIIATTPSGQDFYNHNPGLIGGNQLGVVGSQMYVAYGNSEDDIRSSLVAYEYLTRQLEYSSLKFE